MSDQKVMVITGTSRSIGKYLAEYYVGKGFQVIGCSRGSVDYELKNYQHFCLDVSDEPKVKEMFSEIRRTHNRLDVLINNAGIASVNYTLLISCKAVESMLNTNIIGTFLFCREALTLMMKNKYGRIVNLSTISVPLASVGCSMYSASKAAIEQFSRVLTKEVASYGITVNVLRLSMVKHSGMVDALSNDDVLDLLKYTATKSGLDFEDITHTIDFLISEKSKMVTGEILMI